MKRFFTFWSKQHVFVNLAAFVIIICGTYFAFTITKEAFPQFDFDIVIITTAYPGATPEEVESLVTIPLERELKTVDGVDKIDSITIESRSTIILQLDPDAQKKSRTVKDIENTVERVRVSELPENGDEPLVQELNSNHPVLNVAVSGPIPDEEIRDIAKNLRDDLLDIKGVGQVGMIGFRKKEIWVEADLSDMSRFDVSLLDLIRAIGAANHSSAGGRLVRGSQEILVRTMGKLQTEEDIRQVVLRSNADGSQVLVKDVAEVSERLERERTFALVNGRKSINLTISKKPSGDSLDIADDVRRLVSSWRERVSDGVEFTYSDDTSFYIKRRLNILIKNGLQGLALVLIVLFIFLSPSSAFWTAAAIPIAFLGGLLTMKAVGMTVNLITLFAFVLVSGMLVDDGIVVTEYFERKRAEGLSPREAAIAATSEMALPITAAVCTTIVAFLPLAFVAGIIGKFLRLMPMVLIFTLVADLLEVLFVLPSHLTLTVGRFRTPRPIEALRSFGNRFMNRLEKMYEPPLRWCITHPATTFLFFIVLLGSSLALAKATLQFRMFPVDIDEFYVRFELPVGATLDETTRIAKKVEKILGKIPPDEVDAIITQVGVSGEEGRLKRGTHVGQSRIILDTTGRRKRGGDDIVSEVRAELETIQGLASLEIRRRRAGPPTGKPVEIKLSGAVYPVLKEISEKTQAQLRDIEGVFAVKDDLDEGKEELRIEILRHEATRAGLSVREIASVVRSAFDGETATEIKRADEEEDIDVVVKLPEEARRDETLEKLTITNSQGNRVPLRNLARFSRGKGPLYILRSEAKRTVTVLADVDPDKITSKAVNAQIGDWMPAILRDYPGVNYSLGGEEEDRIESVQSLIKAMIIAGLAIYVLIATLFQSFGQPLIVMSVIPFGFVGVFLTLLIHQLPLSILVMIGMAGLEGVVVNNSIILVEAINRIRRESSNTVEAIVKGAIQRLRPILLTSMTTFFAVIPLGYGIGGREPFLEHVALTFGWGLAFTSWITIFLVPTLYALGIFFGKTFRRSRS